MSFSGKYGEIVGVTCSVGELPVIADGKLLTIQRADRFKASDIPPDNCPRGPFYAAAQELGCVICVQAQVVYENGAIVSRDGVSTS